MRSTLSMMLCLFVPALWALSAFRAEAQSFDGAWAGEIGKWQVSLRVSGTKGELLLVNCNGGKSLFTVDVTADGKIDAWLKDQIMARRHFTAQLPNFSVAPGATAPSLSYERYTSIPAKVLVSEYLWARINFNYGLNKRHGNARAHGLSNVWRVTVNTSN